ncbi:restriction endonuclease subunit S [Paracoccus simplex]|uniref:Restriction endonuclease subunit S n=1 Tax=Paracoccus simplex TaxID=2086346 RepID=A0ABV7S2H3_9RHOB
MTGLPQGWASASIHSFTRTRSGNSKLIKGKQAQAPADGLFPAYSASGQDVWVPDPEHKGNAIIISAVGARCGKTFRAFGRWSAVANTHIVWPEEIAVDADWLQLLLNDEGFWEKGGSAQPFVKVGATFEREIALPPLPEQRRIVCKLDTLSARTTTARTHLTAIEKLVERYKLTVLRSAYAGNLTADFREDSALEPVSALLKRTPPPQQGRGGRQATTEVKAGQGGISVNIPDVNLPEKWEWVSLLRIARQETGHTPSRSRDDWWGGDVCWMSIPDANLHHGRVIFDTIQKTNEQGLANSSARLLPAGTVVLSRTASVGYICIMGREMATSQDFATWTCTDALLPEYLMYALLSEGEDIKKFGEGSTHTTIYFPEIRAFHIKLAPLDEQREIVRRIETAFAKIDRLATEAAKALKLLGRLDQRILAKAFVGELVPQDPTDEPAAALLARIREARAAAPKPKRGRKART